LTGGRDTDAECGGTVDWPLDVDPSKFLGLWLAQNLNKRDDFAVTPVVGW
jgi:hypothetical protein